MKRSKLDKVLWGVNLGPVKRVLPSDQLSPKIYAPQLCSVAVRSAGQVPAAARVAKQGGISGCAQQISQLIECLKGHEVDLPTVCLTQKKAVEQCRAEVAVVLHTHTKKLDYFFISFLLCACNSI